MTKKQKKQTIKYRKAWDKFLKDKAKLEGVDVSALKTGFVLIYR
jgi:hypothetical protein